MRQVMFDIKDMDCGYGGQAVLSVKEMKLEYGKLYFVLGKSGVGKSTLLEALGLMTDTILLRDSEVVFNNSSGVTTNLKHLWTMPNDDIAAFRSQHYAFIFQQTNLMANFAAGENMCFGLMLGGATFAEAKKKVSEVMELIDLPMEIFDKQISELSGGQRQRLAFVRALTADFDVLFGDEPTGNLDEGVANKLMTVLKAELKDHHKTGIIVSHSIPLALAYADEILFIKEDYNGEMRQGRLLPEFRIIRQASGWYDGKGHKVEHPNELLRSVIE